MIVVPPLNITDARLTSSNIPEPDTGEPTEYDEVTNYSVGAEVGVYTVQADIHRRYECLVANGPATTVVRPWEDDGTTWLDTGPTNRWAMFDDGNSTQSIEANEIDVDIDPGEIINAVALINIVATEAQVVMTDPGPGGEGVVYDKTVNLIDNSGIQDWHAYYFTPIERKTDLVLLDLPSYSAATIQVTLTATSSDVKIGSLVLGYQSEIGITDHGTSIGIKDYSRKETDSFGNFVVLKRSFSKRADYAVTVRTNRVAYIQNYLSRLRSLPAVWIGNESFGSTIIFGYYRDFDIILSSPQISDCNIVVEGLT